MSWKTWQIGEPGPICGCGHTTRVVQVGKFMGLLCYHHEAEESAIFPLPNERPPHWPFLSTVEIVEMIEAAFEAAGDDFAPEGFTTEFGVIRTEDVQYD